MRCRNDEIEDAVTVPLKKVWQLVAARAGPALEFAF
jgi:hypothetical protein